MVKQAKGSLLAVRFKTGCRHTVADLLDAFKSDHGIFQKLQSQCQHDIDRFIGRYFALALRLENYSLSSRNS